VVAVYALNAWYPDIATGVEKDLPATEEVVRAIRDAS
jgi:hypothetical protein